MKELSTKKNMLQKLSVAILFIYLLFLLILNIYVIFDNNAIKYAIVVIPVMAACLFAAYRVKLSPVWFMLGIFLASFMIKAIFVLITSTQPVSDFKGIYDCAIRLVGGDTSWNQWSYFSTWAYQTGFVYYYAILIKIFGQGLVYLKLVNCLFMAGTNTLIYLIAKKISSEKAARASALLYMCYPAPIILAPILSNQQFAAFMFFAAIYVLLQNQIKWFIRGPAAGILAAVGNTVRPLGLVIIAALIVWGVIELISRRKLETAGVAALFLSVYFAVFAGISSYFIAAGISPNGLTNQFPLWKFVVGLNMETSGQFSYEDQNNIFLIKDTEQREQAAKAAIKERLGAGPIKLATFFVKKQGVMWASLDTLRWTFYVYEDGKLVAPEATQKIEGKVLKTEKLYYFFVLLLLTVGMFCLMKKKEIPPAAQYILWLLLTFYFVHILIEVQVRYRYFAMVSVFILLSCGAQFLFERFSKAE